MTQMRRRGLSASQKQELWERRKRGQSRNDIARALAEVAEQLGTAQPIADLEGLPAEGAAAM